MHHIGAFCHSSSEIKLENGNIAENTHDWCTQLPKQEPDLKLTSELRSELQREIRHHSLPDDFIEIAEQWYLPVATRIADVKNQTSGTVLISFNGSQGSGKSTMTAFLLLLLKHHFDLNTVEFSIDDFYLTHEERQRLAQDIHPLLATRGVPGTHDVKLAAAAIDCLRHCDAEHPCYLPRFDKAVDDRAPEADWTQISKPVDIMLFEGWCNNAPTQSEQQLNEPINDLERNEDAEGIWRRYANQQLHTYHDALFDQADLLVFLRAPSFEKVYEWRGLQEYKLANSGTNDKHAVMDEVQLRRFIHHYERITRACLEELPECADIVLELDANHAIRAMNDRQAGA